jgi:hypothetical protein
MKTQPTTPAQTASSADSETVEALVKDVATNVSLANQEDYDANTDCNDICNTSVTEAEASIYTGCEAVERGANDTEMRTACNDTKNVQVLKEKEKRKENEERESKKEKKQKKEIKRKKKEKLKEKEKVLTQTPVEKKKIL